MLPGVSEQSDDELKGLKEIVSPTGETFVLLPNFPMPEGFFGPSSHLGKGAFGNVSIAFSEEAEPLAVKLIEIEKSHTDFAAILAEIEKETHIMRHLGLQAEMIMGEDSPNKLQIYVIQPFISGINLDKYFTILASEAADPNNQNDVAMLKVLSKTLSCFIAAFEATQKIHEKNVIHGDLHPGNILYNPDTNKAAIIDFGMSYILPGNSTTIYVTGDAEVSNYHRAPETIKAKPLREGRPPERVYDKSSDVYSLAIDCAIWSDLTEFIPEKFAKVELAALLELFKELSQAKDLGGNAKPQDRKSLADGLSKLKEIKAQTDAQIEKRNLQTMITTALPEIKALASKFAQANARRNEVIIELPSDLKENILSLSQKIHAIAAEQEQEEQMTQLKDSHKRAKAITPHKTITVKSDFQVDSNRNDEELPHKPPKQSKK